MDEVSKNVISVHLHDNTNPVVIPKAKVVTVSASGVKVGVLETVKRMMILNRAGVKVIVK